MKIIVLGAGIAGLVAAYRCKQTYPDSTITIIEHKPQVGGWIDSLHQDGFIFEQGPRSIRPKGKGQVLLKLIVDLDLMDQILIANPAAKRRYIYHQKLLEVPSGLLSLIQSPLQGVFLEALQTDWKLRSFPFEKVSLAQFSRRHFGDRFTRLILQPAVSGIWAGDIEQLSAQATLPQLTLLEQKEGSLLRSWLKKKKKKIPWPYSRELKKAVLISFRQGMSSLPLALAKQLHQHLKLEETVQNIQWDGQTYTVQTNQNSYQAQHIFSALPAHILSPLVFDCDKALSHKLSQIDYAPITVVTLAYQQPVHAIKGFGYLNVQNSSQDILGVVMNDQTFPDHAPSSSQSLSVMIGGARFKNFAQYSQDDFITMAQNAVRNHLGIQINSDIAHCKIMPKAIPQYNMGYNGLTQSLLQRCPLGLHLIGNYMGGVSVIDTIAQAEHSVAKLLTP